jgi:hypothetical protein
VIVGAFLTMSVSIRPPARQLSLRFVPRVAATLTHGVCQIRPIFEAA